MEGLLAVILLLVIVASALIGMLTGDFLWLVRRLGKWLFGLPMRLLRATSRALLQWGKDLRKVRAHWLWQLVLCLLSLPLSVAGILLAIPADIFGSVAKK